MSATLTNRQKFFEAYRRNLERAVIEHPDEYCWPVANVPIVAAKMEAAFERGSYSKDGFAFKATCKEMGIPHTYTAINSFCKA